MKEQQAAIKVVIPARFGSSRLPAKPLLEINNKPIFWHVVQRVLEAGVPLNDIVIATDHLAIFSKAEQLKLPVMMTDTNYISGTDRVNEVAVKSNWDKQTIVINVQGDEPLIPAGLIQNLIDFTVENYRFDITTAVTSINTRAELLNINVVKAIITEFGQALYFTRAPAPLNRDNDAELTLAKRHIGIYAYTVKSLAAICRLPESQLENYEKLEQLRALTNGLTIGAFSYKGDVPHGIDTQDDYDIIKRLMT
ncbi:MAG: 3-deoxy-manno-octulosonate cytidylyltransferase (CMP-KDO synthetase) [Cognaticolwellia sp.]|jgi:3-deoxy-manno-octulosonate cytidylyltransferase (CMP-KDO synthetase)